MQADERGVPVSQAAKILGVSVAALRKRVQRGSLRAYKVDDRWMVVLPVSSEATQDVGTTIDVGHGQDTGQDTLIAQLRSENEYLRGLVAELLHRVPELTAGERAPAPPMREPSDTPVEADRPGPPQRSWWRRLVGG